MKEQEKLPSFIRTCEICEEDFSISDEEAVDDMISIDETKRCIGCYEEWGNEWPDRV